jgi:hypothetical protein
MGNLGWRILNVYLQAKRGVLKETLLFKQMIVYVYIVLLIGVIVKDGVWRIC